MLQLSVEASRLDRRVQLLAPVTARGANFGDVTVTWSVVATVWARRIDVPGSTTTQADQRVATRSVDYIIRWRSDVLDTWRVREVNASRSSRQVGLPTELGRRQGLRLNCEETSDA